MGFFDRFFRPPSRDRFARMLSTAIRRAGETSPLRYESEQFRLLTADDKPHVMYLGNAYQDYCAAPRSKREEVVRPYIRAWFDRLREIPDDFEDVGPDILPVIRSRSFYEVTRLQVELERSTVLDWSYQPFAEHFGLGLVYDLQHSMMQVSGSRFAQWGVSFDDALQVACDNLRERSREGLQSVAPGVWLSSWRDSYDASRLILTDFIERHEVVGDPVAMVPNRDTLLLTGSLDDEGLALMAQIAEDAFGCSRPLTGIAVRLFGETWSPFLPEADHPCYETFKLLRLKSLGRDYANQQEVLNKQHEQAGEDIYVASYTVIQHQETGAYRSYCVWSEGVDTLLPETDLVVFYRHSAPDDQKIIKRVGWDRVQEVAGELMVPQGLYPERYRVQGFPTDEQLVDLGDSI